MAFALDNAEKVVGLHTEKPRPANRADADVWEGEEVNQVDAAFDAVRSGIQADRSRLDGLDKHTAGWINVKSAPYNCKGDATTDDTAGLQAAINAGMNGGVVFLPGGGYKITAPLDIPSNVTLRGTGRHFGTAIIPVGCHAFAVDGSTKVGDWVFRVRVEDLIVTATDASADPIIQLNQGYNIDFANVWVYDTPAPALRVRGSNDVVFTDFIAYGQTTSVGPSGGVEIDGETNGGVTIKFYSPDLEVFNRGFHTAGNVVMDVFSPYVERCVVGYHHGITAGKVGVHGGIISTVNGYPLALYGDHLAVWGTDLDPFQAAERGGLGIYAPEIWNYRDVAFHGVPRMAQTGFIDPAQVNVAQFASDVSYVANKYRRSLDLLPKTLAHGVPTELVKLDYFSNAAFKIRLWGSVGDTHTMMEFSFTNRDSALPSAVVKTSVLNAGTTHTVDLDVSLTTDAVGSLVSVTPSIVGAGTFAMQGEIEIVNVGISGRATLK